MEAHALNEDRRFHPARLRRTILEMAYAGSSGHIACAFSIVELLAVLYRHHLHYPDNDPQAPGRDFVVLSKGHGVMAQYACMLELGWLDKERHILRYFSDGSELKGLSDSRVRGLEVSSGSLGHGFSVGVGIAMGLKRLGSDRKVYALVGDGELNEGAIWEGMLVAAHHKLDNLMLIVDANGFQAMGTTDQVLKLGSLRAKFQAFDFAVDEVDGHDEAAIDASVRSLWAGLAGHPKALVARTVKGKGVPFMEHENQWHYKRMDDRTYSDAMAALPALRETAR
jgi:transketolase